MNDNVQTLELNGRSITLIGTAHISKESIAEVRDTILELMPDCVCVELDEGRYKAMFRGETASGEKNNDWEKLDIIKVFKEGRGFLLLANLILGSFQKRMGSTLGVKPGEEMKAAIVAAGENNIPFTFCDREIQITLNRAWKSCGFFSKCKLLAALLSSAFSNEKLDESEIEKLKAGSELDGMMNELSEYLPEVKTVLIDERDEYLAAKIWESAGNKLVAVVGAGHLHGIKEHLSAISKNESTPDITSYTTLPKDGVIAKTLPWLLPVIIVGIIVAGFFGKGADLSFVLVRRWLLWNGSLAALGSLIAFAHPLAILVSFAGAPIATLNPFIGVGLFSGVVEATMRRPRVEDAETLSDDVVSLKGIYKNRILRALLVFFLSSIGGAIGNFISIPTMAVKLFG